MNTVEELKKLRTSERHFTMHGQTEITTLESYDEYRCIFVHVPRTGGFATAKSLFGNVGGSHIPVATYRAIFDDHEFESYFKFTIVRNPWDRLVSAYRFLMDGGGQVEHDLQMQAKIQPYKDFGDFVRSWLFPSALEDGIHFLPQHVLISLDDGTVPLDYMARFETLHDDFGNIARRLGVQASLQHLNASRRTHYRDYYDQETIEMVAALYRKDIELLDYDFENSQFSR